MRMRFTEAPTGSRSLSPDVLGKSWISDVGRALQIRLGPRFAVCYQTHAGLVEDQIPSAIAKPNGQGWRCHRRGLEVRLSGLIILQNRALRLRSVYMPFIAFRGL